jgi:uncharacterized ParB-like nuclease family protein
MHTFLFTASLTVPHASSGQSPVSSKGPPVWRIRRPLQPDTGTQNVGSEFATMMSMGSTIVCNVKPCRLVEVPLYFGEMVCLRLQGVRVSKQTTRISRLLLACVLILSVFHLEVRSSETSVNFYQTARRHILQEYIIAF